MATLLFDPPCIRPPIRSELARPCERTPVAAKFVSGRQVHDFEDERITLVLENEPVDVARYVEMLWSRTFGGTLPMDYQPPDGRPAFEVRFGREPRISHSQLTHVTVTIRIDLEKRVI